MTNVLNRYAGWTRHGVLTLGLLLLGASVVSACGSSAAPDKDTLHATDGGGGDAVAACRGPYTSDTVCWTGCHQRMASSCDAAGCMDWPLDVKAFCSVYTPAKAIVFLDFAEACGPYHVLRANGPDSGTSLYYSKATGKLIASVFHDYQFRKAECKAGPSDFVEPRCDFVKVDCGDAGVPDAGGSGGAAGAYGGGAAAAGGTSGGGAGGTSGADASP